MSNTLKAAYWMIGAMFSFSLMAISGRELGGHLDTFEIMMYRSLIGIFIVLIFIILWMILISHFLDHPGATYTYKHTYKHSLTHMNSHLHI